jgi:methylmalonyl-CoA mutase
MMTARDPWVNMLRTTMAAFAAGLGGADAVTVLPFTAAIGLPDRFARRVARNSQLILIEESHLAKVADPAAGSGGFEDLTRQLCAVAWAFFQDIERAGGAAAALQSGLVQTKVAAVREQRAAAIAHRIEAIVGTSAFPHLAEAPVSVLARSPGKAPAHAPASRQNGAGLRIRPLPALRLAEPFEALRDAADAILERSGARPKVFLATLGTPADFTARAMFAKNLFEAGGIEATASDGYADRAAMLAAFKSSGARLACLCSSDEVYAREAVDAAKSLAGAGAAPIYLAGRPGEAEAGLRAAGVDRFIHAGCDALKTLAEAHDRIAAGAPAGR